MLEKNYIARVMYDCITPEGKPFQLIAEMYEYGGSQYGNNHCIAFQHKGAEDWITMDVRCDKRFCDKHGFYENVLDVLKDVYKIGGARRILME